METATISSELQCVFESVKSRPTFKMVILKSAANYCCAVAKQGNFPKGVHDKQKKNSRAGLIKVSILSNNIAKQSDTSLAWIMFHKIDLYIGILKNKKLCKHSYSLKGLHFNFESTKAARTSPATPVLSMPLHSKSRI